MTTYTSKLKEAMPGDGKCNWKYNEDRNKYLTDSCISQIQYGNFVISGGNLTNPTGLNIDIDETIANINGSEFLVQLDTLLLTEATTESEERNWLYIDDTGTLIVSIIPPVDSFCLIGLVDTSVNSIIRQADLRQKQLGTTELETVENDCINGSCDIWQRGNSQAINGYASVDRFSMTSNDGAAFSLDKEININQEEYGGETPENRIAINVTNIGNSAAYTFISHKILNVRKYSNKTVVFSLNLENVNMAGQAIVTIQAFQNFGTGGSVALSLPQQHIEYDSVAKQYILFFNFPTVENKTIGELSYTEFKVIVSSNPATNINSSNLIGKMILGEIRIYANKKELLVRKKSKEEELENCFSYYEKSFNLDTPPSNGNTNENFISNDGLNVGISGNVNSIGINVKYKEKISSPNVTLFGDLSNKISSVLILDPGVERWDLISSFSITNIGNKSFCLVQNIVNQEYIQTSFHWTVESEI